MRKNTSRKLNDLNHISSMWQNWYSKPSVLTSSLVFLACSWRGKKGQGKWKRTGLSSFLSHSCFGRKIGIGFSLPPPLLSSLPFSELYARHYAQVLNKYLIWCSQQPLLHYSFSLLYICENWTSEMLNDLSKVIQLARSRVEIQTQVV